MLVPYSPFRLGLCLMVIGGFTGFIAYASWSSLMVDLNRTCWSETPASGCTSIALSAGFWTPILGGSVVLQGAGLLLALVSAARDARLRHPMAP